MRRGDTNKNETTIAIALNDALTTSSEVEKQQVNTKEGDYKDVSVSKVAVELNNNTIIQDEQKKFFSVFVNRLQESRLVK